MIQTIVLVAYTLIAGAVLLRVYQHNAEYTNVLSALIKSIIVAVFWPFAAMYAGLQLILEED